MGTTETVQQFYSRVQFTGTSDISINNAGSGHFNVFPRSICSGKTPFGRRDYYKVSLILGPGKLNYADQWLLLDKPCLLFSNPVIPYSFEAMTDDRKGWSCVFTEAFVHPDEKTQTLQDSPLFRLGAVPAFFVNKKQEKEISGIFLKMMEEMASEYAHKFDLLRNYLHLIIHQAMKMQPAERLETSINASTRITHLFLELLERQFPIVTPDDPLLLKTANHFAERLSMHVNHLNRALKEVTGKTTTEHISARVIKEAMALLRYSDWNIAQIAYGLGFEYPAYFNIF